MIIEIIFLIIFSTFLIDEQYLDSHCSSINLLTLYFFFIQLPFGHSEFFFFFLNFYVEFAGT